MGREKKKGDNSDLYTRFKDIYLKANQHKKSNKTCLQEANKEWNQLKIECKNDHKQLTES